jgi:Pyruvate/2-oxoacid:ferredoxin oxidoreductase delta subunit
MKEFIKKYFEKLRHNKKFHLGLGDIRLTVAMQEEILKELEKYNCENCGQVFCEEERITDYDYDDIETTKINYCSDFILKE